MGLGDVLDILVFLPLVIMVLWWLYHADLADLLRTILGLVWVPTSWILRIVWFLVTNMGQCGGCH